MYISVQNSYYNYNIQNTSHIETITTSISNDGTFAGLNDMIEKLSLRIKPTSDKEKIFDMFEDSVYFGDDEKKKVDKYINSICVKEKDNIFDYYA